MLCSLSVGRARPASQPCQEVQRDGADAGDSPSEKGSSRAVAKEMLLSHPTLTPDLSALNDFLPGYTNKQRHLVHL